MRPIFLLLNLGTPELIVIGMVGLLLFGRRLPDVGRSLGKSFLEFKSGLNDMKSELSSVDRLVDEQSERRATEDPIDVHGEVEVESETKEDQEATPDEGDNPRSS
ncbi:MAG: sec-independent protein translocase protein TatA [Planctomycetota bacterium]|jgi:sec-independent protein translocase protein TatA